MLLKSRNVLMSNHNKPADPNQRHTHWKQLVALGALAVTLAGGIIGSMRGNNHDHNSAPTNPAYTTSQLEHSYQLGATINAPDGHSELVIGTQVAQDGSKTTELFVSTDNGADWRAVVAG